MTGDPCPDHRRGSHRGCRACRAYAARRMAEMRERNQSKLVTRNGRDFSVHSRCKHGTVSGYTNYSCRCDDCTKANAAWQASRSSSP